MRALRVVIVAWNSGADLDACLASLAAAQTSRFRFEEVVVVDNGSTDGAPARLDARGLPLRIVRNDRNRGYAAAANQGWRGTGADFVLFLNPDARVRPDTLDVVVARMEEPSQRDVGICGVALEDERGVVQRECAAFPSSATFLAKSFALDVLLPGRAPRLFLDSWDHLDTRDVDHVMGAFFFVRAPVLTTLDGFDERFFVYLEDLDFSLRARAAGWRTRYLAEARIFHRGGKTSSQARPERLAYSLESRLRYAFKHFSPMSAAAVAAASLLVEPVPRAARAVLRRSPGDLEGTLRGYALLVRRLAASRGGP